jgi:alkanesulfonate monooxygenase SsuD/methylene tetrahydromethanopterin reductase-like flavin-dependent oxidoreductase (luciferase family)
VSELVDLARSADHLGYRTIWASEAWGRDAFVLLSHLASATTRTRLGTGIVNAWGRSAGTIAQAVGTLDEVSNGRALVGLGVSGPRVVEGFHERTWHRPLEQLQQVTATIRTLLQGERHNGFALQFTPVRSCVPVYWGVYGPRSIESAGAHADGWLAGELPLDLFGECALPLHRGAHEAGRPSPPIAYMLQVVACETEAQLVEARTLTRRDIAFRVGGLGPFHRRSLASRGFRDVCRAVSERWSAGDRVGATAAVSDELLDAMACVGSPAEAARHIARAARLGIAEPVVTVPRGLSSERIHATLAACAPE